MIRQMSGTIMVQLQTNCENNVEQNQNNMIASPSLDPRVIFFYFLAIGIYIFKQSDVALISDLFNKLSKLCHMSDVSSCVLFTICAAKSWQLLKVDGCNFGYCSCLSWAWLSCSLLLLRAHSFLHTFCSSTQFIY